MVYVNVHPLAIFSADRQTYDKYNKLVLRVKESFEGLEVQDQVPKIDKNGSANTIPID